MFPEKVSLNVPLPQAPTDGLHLCSLPIRRGSCCRKSSVAVAIQAADSVAETHQNLAACTIFAAATLLLPVAICYPIKVTLGEGRCSATLPPQPWI